MSAKPKKTPGLESMLDEMGFETIQTFDGRQTWLEFENFMIKRKPENFFLFKMPLLQKYLTNTLTNDLDRLAYLTDAENGLKGVIVGYECFLYNYTDGFHTLSQSTPFSHENILESIRDLFLSQNAKIFENGLKSELPMLMLIDLETDIVSIIKQNENSFAKYVRIINPHRFILADEFRDLIKRYFGSRLRDFQEGLKIFNYQILQIKPLANNPKPSVPPADETKSMKIRQILQKKVAGKPLSDAEKTFLSNNKILEKKLRPKIYADQFQFSRVLNKMRNYPGDNIPKSEIIAWLRINRNPHKSDILRSFTNFIKSQAPDVFPTKYGSFKVKK